MKRIHDAHLAGRWYTADPATLRREIDAFLDRATLPTGVHPAACVVPHAGYMYSGRAAAHAYALVSRLSIARVVLLAPSHYAYFRGAVTLGWDAFRTPFGLVPIDRAAVRQCLELSWVREDPAPFGPEHALEIQLPFLQVVQPDVAVVPLLVGEVSLDQAHAWGSELAAMWDAETLLLVSSDLTHYGERFQYLPFPPRNAEFVRAQLKALDSEAIARICVGDPSGFYEFVEATGATICGRNPILLFLGAHAQRTPGVLLSYYTSLDVTGDYGHVVSYAAIAFPTPPPPQA